MRIVVDITDRRTARSRLRGQTFIEYVFLFSVVSAIAIVLSPLMRRGIQSMVKSVADQIAPQICAEQKGGLDGGLERYESNMAMGQRRRVLERLGNVTYSYEDGGTWISSYQASNTGFVPD